MVDVIAALEEYGDVGAQIVDLLYGDAAVEVSKTLSEVSKLTEENKKKIAVGGNILGLTAGTAAIAPEIRNTRNALRKVRNKAELPEKEPISLRASKRAANMKPGILKPLARAGAAVARHPRRLALATAGGSLGLQLANVTGDAVVGSVLNEKKPKKPKPVAKNLGVGVDFYTEISKVDTDKRQVFGWASVTSVGGVPVRDLQDDLIDLEEIEKAAYSYVEKSRKGGMMHQRGMDGSPVHVSDMIESFVVTKAKKEALGLPDEVPEGWWVGYQIHDDATWRAVKDGKLAGLSIHGIGKRTEVA